MARPSKLNDKQWGDIKRRIAGGEKAADLAREYGVSRQTISERCQKRAETIKDVAHQIVSADAALRQLPVSEQLLARNLLHLAHIFLPLGLKRLLAGCSLLRRFCLQPTLELHALFWLCAALAPVANLGAVGLIGHWCDGIRGVCGHALLVCHRIADLMTSEAARREQC